MICSRYEAEPSNTIDQCKLSCSFKKNKQLVVVGRERKEGKGKESKGKERKGKEFTGDGEVEVSSCMILRFPTNSSPPFSLSFSQTKTQSYTASVHNSMREKLSMLEFEHCNWARGPNTETDQPRRRFAFSISFTILLGWKWKTEVGHIPWWPGNKIE